MNVCKLLGSGVADELGAPGLEETEELIGVVVWC